MCVGSMRSRRQEPAVAGVAYGIGETRYDDSARPERQGVIFAEGNGYEPETSGDGGKVIRCAACITAETKVILSGIPQALQQKLGIGPIVPAAFVPGSPNSRRSQDKIRIGDRLFKLWEFADQGVSLMLAVAASDSDDDIAPAAEPALAREMPKPVAAAA